MLGSQPVQVISEINEVGHASKQGGRWSHRGGPTPKRMAVVDVSQPATADVWMLPKGTSTRAGLEVHAVKVALAGWYKARPPQLRPPLPCMPLPASL
jgi:hypothetical protein